MRKICVFMKIFSYVRSFSFVYCFIFFCLKEKQRMWACKFKDKKFFKCIQLEIYKEQSLVLYSDTSVNISITDLILVIKHFKAFHWLFRRAFVIHLWFTNHTASMRIQQRAMYKIKFNQRILWNKFYFNSQ